MTNFTEQKWKYLSITLSVLVAAFILTPQASAAKPDISDVLTAIANAVTSIQNSISSSASSTQTNIQDSISTSATETQTNVGTVHAISLDDVSFDPTPGVSQSLYIFGAAGGPSHSGQITFHVSGPLGAAGNEFVISCDVSNSGGVEFVYTEEGSYTQDFTCTLVNIVVYDNGAGSGAGPITVNGLLQYTTADDVTTISLDIP